MTSFYMIRRTDASSGTDNFKTKYPVLYSLQVNVKKSQEAFALDGTRVKMLLLTEAIARLLIDVVIANQDIPRHGSTYRNGYLRSFVVTLTYQAKVI